MALGTRTGRRAEALTLSLTSVCVCVCLRCVKLEEEISTLRQVLSSKEKQHAELKQKLGVTPLNELRNNFSRGWQDMQTSTA